MTYGAGAYGAKAYGAATAAVSILVTAGLVSGTATAHSATATVAPLPVQVNAGTVTSSATVQSAAVHQVVEAGLVTSSSAVRAASTEPTLDGGLVTGSGTVLAAMVEQTVEAGVVSGASVVQPALVHQVVEAGTATASGTVHAASSVAGVATNAGLVAGSGTVLGGLVEQTVDAGTAAGSSVVHPASVGLSAPAGILTGTATVHPAMATVEPLPVQVAAGTVSGTGTVLAGTATAGDPSPPPPPYLDEVLADNPVVYYRLDEASGTTFVDASGNDRDATVTDGSPAFGQPGIITTGDAVGFDGTVWAKRLGDVGLASPRALECWIRTTSSDGWPIALATSSNTLQLTLRILSTNGTMLGYTSGAGSGSVSSIDPINDGLPHHLVLQWNPTTTERELWVDGVLTDTAATSTPPSASVDDLFVGGRTGIDFIGDLDEIAVYDTYLPQSRVEAHYAAGTAVPDVVVNAGVVAGASALQPSTLRFEQAFLTGSGTWDWTAAGEPSEVEVLVVGGGGGSGDRQGGGGGGGEVVYVAAHPVSGDQTWTVGPGGAGGDSNRGSPGAASTFGSLTAAGGGGGGSRNGTRTGGNGACGGGGAYVNDGGTGNPGFDGGDANSINLGAGGGGMGSAGGNNTSSASGDGGAGIEVAAFADYGESGWFAGGGGGGAYDGARGVGGQGGGGDGGDDGVGATGAGAAGTPGAANTGGGAGGNSYGNPGADGGSGVIVFRWSKTAATSGPTVSPGVATGVGVVQPASVIIIDQQVGAGTATGTGAVQPASVSFSNEPVTVQAGVVSETGALFSATAVADVVVTAGTVTGTGAALPATVLDSLTPYTVQAGTVAGAGSVLAVEISVGQALLAGTASGAGVVLPAAVEVAGTTVAGVVTGSGFVYPASVDVTPVWAAETRNQIGGRRRDGIATVFWEPDVVVPPLGEVTDGKREVAHSFGPVTITSKGPSYEVSSAMRTATRYRILVGSRDVTFFRGAPTPFPGFSLVEPLMYGSTQITFPQISAAFETPGEGALRWCRKWAPVVIQQVNPETSKVVSTDYRGLIVGYDHAGPSLSISVGGEATGRAAMSERQPPLYTWLFDLGRWGHNAIRALGLRFTPYLGPTTGITARTFGGMSMLEYINQIVAMSWNRSGNRWTIMPVSKGRYQMIRKDLSTIHATVYNDDARTVATLQRDLTEEPNRIFMTGVDPEGQRVRFGQYPGLKQSPPAPYPFNDGRTFGVGTTNADTDTGDGIWVLIGHMRVMKYMDAIEAPGGYDADVARGIRELQRDAGLAVTGEVNPATWNALYDLSATGFSLRWMSIQPAAERSQVRKWRKSASGARMSRNPHYDRHVPRVDRNVDAGTGFERTTLREWARTELTESTEDNYVGSITFGTGAVVKGLHTPGDPITTADVFSARDLRPGMNLRLPHFAGGITVHVSAVTIDGEESVTAEVDTRARDAQEVWEIIARNRESRRSPYREWLNQHRQSTQTKDAIGVWDEVGGILGADVPIPANTWTVFPVVAGQEGTIRLLQMRTNPNAEYAMAIFGRKIDAKKLERVIGNPLTAAGTERWTDEDRQARLDERHILLYVAGSDEEPLGYFPRKKGKGPLTGRWVDAAGVSYHTGGGQPVLYVAVYADRDTVIPNGRLMRVQLESSV